ncbi:L,D-transpeptidase [Akkermansiaceae bacterium]|nr:L,D-transpeptidase [Akkermansiaceae bacterium]MDB4537577.1 L,D-transpeptidase [Akkermansiaceae bacterium]
MKNILTASCFLVGTLIFSSCSGSSKLGQNAHEKFKARKDYRTTMDVYMNEDAYAKTPAGETRIYIDLSDQRAQLLAAKNAEVLIDTPVCTGRSSKPTPPGRYPIQEKIVHKRSSIFGTTYYRGKRVHGGDRRSYRGRRDRYVGAKLPYWMRMTGSGIGMHGSSSVHRHPASSGCVRTPHDIIPKIFNKVSKGTTIVVVP